MMVSPRVTQVLAWVGMSVSVTLIVKIFTHPAGGWEFEGSWEEWISLLLFTGAIIGPFVWLIIAVTKFPTPIVCWLSLGYFSSLVIFFGLGFIGYGHGTPFLMLLGLIAGWVFWMVAVFKTRHSKK